MKPVVAIFGPTASGKSSLGLNLAKELDGVIISADSMQIYQRLDVGTAKPDSEMLTSVPHRLIDICDPKEKFSVYDYKLLAENEIEKVHSEEKLPILVGGTGLYFDALFFNTDFGEFETDEKVREDLKRRSENGENALLLEELRGIDPESAAPLHEKDSKRIVRALEVYYTTGKTLTEFKKESHKEKTKFDFIKFNLCFKNREILYERINLRVDEMLRLGLLEETKKLLDDGVFEGTTCGQAIGYKELLPYFQGNASLEDCILLLKQKTRNYAKRQITWFRRYEDSNLIFMDEDENPYGSLLATTQKFLEGKK